MLRKSSRPASSKQHRAKPIRKLIARFESLEPRAMLSADSTLFVGGVYEKLLERAPEEAGAQYWSGLLESGASREQIVLGVLASDEFRASQFAANLATLAASDQVEHFYSRFLGRGADSGGLDFWISKLDADGMNSVISGILGSGESEQQIRAATNSDNSDDGVLAFNAAPQALAGVPFVVGQNDFSQISPSARLYAPQENPPYGPTSNSSASQQDAMTQALGFNFVTFYDQNNKVNLARRPVDNSTPWKVINLGNIVNTVDNHKTPNVAVSQVDGRIHLAYGHHAENLRYRMSIAGAATVSDAQFTTANLFGGTAGAERNFLKSGEPMTAVTYPIFVTLETTKKLIFFWRQGTSGDGDIMVSRYNDNGTWGGRALVVDGQTGTYVDQSGSYPGPEGTSNDRNAYPNDIVVKGGDIHLTWTWRETATPPVAGGPITNHDLMYAKSSDGGLTWTNAGGVVVGTSGAGSFKMNVNSDVRVTAVNGGPLTLDYDWRLINSNTSYVDSLGNTHVVLRHAQAAESGTQRYWHYVRTGATWTQTMLPFTAASRPKMFIDRVTDTVYVSAVVAGRIRLFAAQKGTDDWGTWNQIYQSSVTYKNDGPNGRMSADGRTIWLVGQRAGAAADSTSSRIELIRITVDPNISDPELTTANSGLQALAGTPSIVGAPEFSLITSTAQLYPAGAPYGLTAISNSTQQNSIVIAFGKLFVAYYDQANRLTLRRRDIATGVWSNPITFTQTVTGNDAHKTPNIGISSDGRIHLVYGQNLSPLRYQFSTVGAATVSNANFTLARFTSGERNYLVSGVPLNSLSYPMFITQESTGVMMMMWREDAGGDARHSYMATYSFDGSGTWGGKRMVIDGLNGTYDDPNDTFGPSNDRNAYYNDVVTYGNEIHITWTWREDRFTADSNHDLMYAKSIDRGLTWTNADGATVGTSGAGSYKINVNSDVMVDTVNGAPFHLGQDWKLINSNTSYVDGQGNTHVVLRHAMSAGSTTQRYFHYVRTGNTWTQTMLPFNAGYRPKMFIDRVTDTVYVTAVVGGYLRIFAAQKGSDDWGTWNQIYTTTTVRYANDGMNGRISDDGRTLWMLGQRVGATSTSTSSRLETIKFTLNPNV